MSLLWHLIKTDLRHARWSLLAWSLAQLLFTAVSLSLWYAPGFFIERPLIAQPALGFATFALLFAAYDFGVRIVQADNPCVPHAFWRARPISPTRLLTAKLLTLLVCSLAAAIPAASIFLTHRITENFSINPAPMLAVWLFQLPFLGLAVLFASFTPSTRHCLLATVLAVVAFGIWASTSIVSFATSETGLTTVRLFIGASLVAATAASAVIHQYRTARFRRSLTLLGIGLAIAFTVPLWWHFPLPVHETIAPEAESAITRDILLQSVQLKRTSTPRRSGRSRFDLETDFTPPPPGHLLFLDSVRQHWPDGNITAEQGSTHTRQIPEKYARTAISGHNFNADGTIEYYVSLPPDEAFKLRDRGATREFTIECTLTLSRLESVSTLPLRVHGRAISTGSAGLAKVVAIDPSTKAFWVSSLEAPRPAIEGPYRHFGVGVSTPATYFLVRRPTAEIISLNFVQSTNGLGAKLSHFTLGESFTIPTDARWLEDCDLVQVAPRPVARFTRTISSTP